MDKPSSLLCQSPLQKRGFALIITLSVLTVVIALTGVLVGYLDSARKEASGTKALIQANLYFTDLKAIIGKFKEKKTLYNTLYLSPVPLESPDGRFSLLLQCRPMTNGININWLGYGEKRKMAAQYNAAQKVFETLMQMYNIEDAGRLEEMIREASEADLGRADEEKSRLRQKNGMISYQQFGHILRRYQLETDDKNIEKVPWRKYFVFNPVSEEAEKNVMAGDYLSPELLAILFNIDKEVIEGEWTEAEGALKTFLSNNGITYDTKLFAEAFVDRSRCEVSYGYEEERYMFSFVDEEGEVKNFEFYGKQ